MVDTLRWSIKSQGDKIEKYKQAKDKETFIQMREANEKVNIYTSRYDDLLKRVVNIEVRQGENIKNKSIHESLRKKIFNLSNEHK